MFKNNFNLFTTEGVLGRLHYLGFRVLTGLVLLLPLNLLADDITNAQDPGVPLSLLFLGLFGTLIYTSICLVTKRVRDIYGEEYKTKNAVMWNVACFIPFANIVVSLLLLFKKGEITSKEEVK